MVVFHNRIKNINKYDVIVYYYIRFLFWINDFHISFILFNMY